MTESLSPRREAIAHAAQLLQRGAVDEARTLLRAVVDQEPGNVDALNLLGIALARRQDFTGAVDILQRAVAGNPQHAGTHLNFGNALKKVGRLPEAAAYFRRAIELRPDGIQAYRQLGSVLLDLQHFDEALELYNRVLAQVPNDALLLNDRGLVHLGTGRFEAALADFEAALTVNATLASALGNKGIAQQRMGRAADAVASFERLLALQPDNWEALFGLGMVHLDGGNPNAAIDSLNRAAPLRPDHAGTYLGRARAARAIGNPPAALYDLDNVLRLDPNNIDALALRAGIYREMGKRADALVDCDSAIEIDPQNWRLHNNRGALLDELGRSEEALLCFEKSLEINPNNPDAFLNMGSALLTLKRSEEAIAKYDHSLELDPTDVDIYNCKGAVLIAMRRFGQALAAFDGAVAVAPDSAISNFHRAFALLGLGRLGEGFEAYEWRRRGPIPMVQLPNFQQREIEPGEDPRGKTLLLYSEQGMGDIMQFARFARSYADKGASVVLATYPALVRLLSTMGPGITVVPPEGPAPEFELTCPLMSAAHKLGITNDTIPADVPYLFAPPELVDAWRGRLAGLAPGLRVGLTWSGNPQFANDWTRSIAFERLRAILDVPGATFISVQRDVRSTDEEALAAAGVVDVRGLLTDFGETAALVSELDVVIAVDTSMAHLAGAMGKPVWVLLSAVSDWRWLEHRSDSPWYPTARLFRQKEIGDWDPVFAEIRAGLIDLAAKKRSAQ